MKAIDLSNERFIDAEIGELSMEYDKIRGMNVNVARISPDFIDGLKPVQRRTLYIMYLKDGGKKPRKLATISGEVFGKAHPHSPTSVEDSVINIAQEWHNSIPLITGIGNFGDASGSVAGASRYIQAKLSDYCRACFFEDWKDSVVDMELAYDEETMMPLYLPSKYPNVLLNGCLGIGYGMSSFMFCCNFRELVEATILLMRHPNAPIVLIPESPTGASIVETDFAKLCNSGKGSYVQRCTYEIDPESNKVTITSLPDQVTAVEIREKIADIKEKGGLSELLAMNDLSGKVIQIELIIRDDVNPYRFMRKLIGEVPGLEKAYSVSITVINNYNAIDYSVKDLLLQWIQWRREQKRIVVSHKRTRLYAEQRENDVKIFIMHPKRLKRTIDLFTSSKNRKAVEEKLIQEYRDTEIRMDSLQARTISQMAFTDLCQDNYEKCLKLRDELQKELEEVERELDDPDGIDKLIIGELRDGIKRFGTPRRSNVVPRKIKISTDVEGACIMQLTADGLVTRKMATNVDADPIPADSNGFAVYIQNDSSFILINELGYHSFIRAKDIPLDTQVPVHRYMKRPLNGRIVAMLPVDIDMDYCCVLVSKAGQVKRFRIGDIVPSKKPCIALEKGDTIVRGVVVRANSKKDLLVYTTAGKGQRLSANDIRITSPTAKGVSGFKLRDDEICGVFAINPIDNQFLLYTTIRGKQRLNNIEFLIPRSNKNEQMISLIPLTDRDKLQSIVAVNKLDKVQVYFKDGISELLDLSLIPESTMSTPPRKYLKKTVESFASQVIKVVVK